MEKLPKLTEHQGFMTALQERTSIKATIDSLKAEADAKAQQAAELRKNVVTIEDLDEAEELERQAARGAKRAELAQPSLCRAMQVEESQRRDARKAIIDAATSGARADHGRDVRGHRHSRGTRGRA